MQKKRRGKPGAEDCTAAKNRKFKIKKELKI